MKNIHQISTVTEKYQATIPKKIRDILQVKAGDKLLFEVRSDNSITIRKSTRLDLEYAKALSTTLDEWGSKNDEEAYRSLHQNNNVKSL